MFRLTMFYPNFARIKASQTPVANMTLSVNHIELSVPQGTPIAYLAELIGALA